RNPDIARLVRNEWVRLALLAPDAATIKVYRDGAFHDYHPQAEELPRAASSVDWYRGWRGHLGFAEIGSEGGGRGEGLVPACGARTGKVIRIPTYQPPLTTHSFPEEPCSITRR